MGGSSGIILTGVLAVCAVLFVACWQPWKPRPRHTARAVEQLLARQPGAAPVPLEAAPPIGSMSLEDERRHRLNQKAIDWAAEWRAVEKPEIVVGPAPPEGGPWPPPGPEDWPGPGGAPWPPVDVLDDSDDQWVARLKADVDALPWTPPATMPAVRARSCPTCHSIGPRGKVGRFTCNDVWHSEPVPAGPVQGPAGAQQCGTCGSLPVPVYDQAGTLVRYGPACGCGERLAETGDLSAVAERIRYDLELEDQGLAHAAFLDELEAAWDRLRLEALTHPIERNPR